jgi:hypothetical protein
VKPNGKTVRVLDIEQRNLALQPPFQVWSRRNPVRPIHAVTHAASPVMARPRAGATFFKAQRVDGEPAPAPFQNFAANLRTVLAAL